MCLSEAIVDFALHGKAYDHDGEAASRSGARRVLGNLKLNRFFNCVTASQLNAMKLSRPRRSLPSQEEQQADSQERVFAEVKMPNGPSIAGRPLHLLICSNTVELTYVAGADRDWVNLLNALGPSCVRVTWAGIEGTKYLRKN